MTRLDDVRKAIEATVGSLTPAKAQQLAKSFSEPGAAKEQVAKTAADLLEWSHRNRERVRDAIAKEIQDQMRQVGVATQKDVDALKKRVRELERSAGMTASGRKPAARKPAARKPAARKTTAKKTTARKPAAATAPDAAAE